MARWAVYVPDDLAEEVARKFGPANKSALVQVGLVMLTSRSNIGAAELRGLVGELSVVNEGLQAIEAREKVERGHRKRSAPAGSGSTRRKGG